jgi:hypothetical protein
MKQSFLALVMLSLAFVVLTGCNNSGGKNTGGPGDQAQGGGQTPAPDRRSAQPPGEAPIHMRYSSVSCAVNSGDGMPLCYEIEAKTMTPVDVATMNSDCSKQPGGTFAITPCSPTNHIGTCLINYKGVPAKIRFYSPIPVATARAHCVGRGEFTPNY